MKNVDLRDLKGEEKRIWKKAINDQHSWAGWEGLLENEPFMVHEDNFEDYAQELAEDIGAISRDTEWPATCIDWEEAADQLKQDYTDIEVDGETYYFRSY